MTPPIEHPSPDALIALAVQYAKQMLSGELAPYDASKRIWRECHRSLPDGDHRLDPLVYWASEREDTAEPSRLALCDHALRTAAATLIETGSAI